jgi:hypothetical protein
MPAPLVKIDLEFPYTRSVGPVIGAYLDGLEVGRLLASRAGDRTLRFAEAALQVQGKAGEHQVEGAKVALGHAYGAMAQYFAMAVLSSSPAPF